MYWCILLVCIMASKGLCGDFVCNNLEDYAVKYISRNCWFNPDVDSNVADVLYRNSKYTYEKYNAVTEDGYILTIFRFHRIGIKYFKSTVFLSSAFTTSTMQWIDKGVESLAFILADAGYDVWSGNFRGNEYSSNHRYFSKEREPNKYWNFSFHEMGIYDIPTQLNLIKKKTNVDKIYFLGYSMGTTAAFIYASLLPEHCKKHVHSLIMWTPTTHLRAIYEKFYLKWILEYSDTILSFLELFQLTDVVATNIPHFFRSLLGLFCFTMPGYAKLCSDLSTCVFGPTKFEDPQKFPLLLYNCGSGMGPKILNHYAQIIRARGRFQFYDYELIKNSPPQEYPIEKITVPVTIFYASNDLVVPKQDAVYIYNKIDEKYRNGIQKFEFHNHVDFIYSKNISELIAKPTLEVIENFFKKGKECKVCP